jgi:uncharacterized membrane protein
MVEDATVPGGGAIWIVYALLCAFFLSLTDLFTKKFARGYSGTQIAFGRALCALPVLWAFALAEGIPRVDASLLWIFALSLPLEITATLLYIRAISISPLSLTVPFLSFTPVFLLFTASVMLGEAPGVAGIAGVALIAAGAYLLNVHHIREGFLAPLKSLASERGARLMLLVAFLYSITSSFGKLAINASSPSFFAASYFTLLALSFAVLAVKRRVLAGSVNPRIFLVGAFYSVMITFHVLALKTALVSYMVAIKRSSLLFSIVFGIVFFRERSGVAAKIAGGVVMGAGMLVIALIG